MTNSSNTSPQEGAAWAMPEISPPEGPNRTQADIAQWRELVSRVISIAERNGWTKAETARRAGQPGGTFHQWVSGTYTGRLDTTNAKILAWLDTVEEMEAISAAIPASPPFMLSGFARECGDTLLAAQTLPAMVMICAAAGMGKTMTARHYAATRPHCYLATISPHTRTVHGMLVEIADEIEVAQHNPGRLVRSIGTKLQRSGGGTLLIIDEAQNLIDEAINQLRHFVDNYQCGVALLGNEEIYTRFGKNWTDGPRYGQLRRRIFKRIRHMQPSRADLDRFIAAWGIKEADQVSFLRGVGLKPGSLGQIDMTCKLAAITAHGANRAISLGDLKAAWSNRDVEDA